MSVKHLLAASLLCISPLVQAQQAERWFEIEVLIFKHLEGQDSLHEAFADELILPNTSGADGILTRFLQPDVSLLKQHLPLCDAATSDPLDKPAPLPPVYPFWDFEQPYTYVDELNQVVYQGVLADDLQAAAAWLEEYQTRTLPQPTDTVTALASEQADVYAAASPDAMADDAALGEVELADADNLNLSYSREEFDREHIAKVEIWQPQRLDCSFAEELSVGPDIRLKRHANIDFNAYPVDSVPRLIEGKWQSYDSTPYVINSDELAFNDLRIRMQRSREYAPRLHMAWRQPVWGRSRAKATHLYAGEYFSKSYDANGLEVFEQHQPYQTLTERMQEAVNLGEDNLDPELTRELLLSQIQRILDEPQSVVTDPVHQQQQENSEQDIWEIDGLFRVYVEHYLFIEIDMLFQQPQPVNQDSELALMQKDSGQLSAPLHQLRSIPFKQNRRVISGETHYFDHPFMGIVVQIRRFDPTKHHDEWLAQQETQE